MFMGTCITFLILLILMQAIFGLTDNNTFSDKCQCNGGSVYSWESANDSIPYTDFYINVIAYALASDKACNLCVCTEDNLCYTPANNNSFNLNFIPFCENGHCHMYGVVYHRPFFKDDTLIDSENHNYESPLPFLVPLGEVSGYLKVVSVGCSGCSNLLSSKDCSTTSPYYSNETNYLKTDFTSTFSVTQTIIIVICFFAIAVVSTIPYVLVLYIILKKNEFWKSDVYKLIFHLGLFTLADTWIRVYYASTWGFWYGPVSRRFIVATLNFISIGITILTFALALNRWDVLASPSKFKSPISRSVFYLVRIIIISSYLFGLVLLVWQSLPGWGRFMIDIKTPSDPIYIQVREYRALDLFYAQSDIEQGLMVFSLILYLWCLIDIIYKRLVSKNKVPTKEFLLFIQTLSPCLVRIGANVLTMVYTSGDSLFLLVTSLLWLFESCHYPFLYIGLNKSLRYAIRMALLKRKSSAFTRTAVSVMQMRNHISKF